MDDNEIIAFVVDHGPIHCQLKGNAFHMLIDDDGERPITKQLCPKWQLDRLINQKLVIRQVIAGNLCVVSPTRLAMKGHKTT